jgi:hypothetical protein
MKKSNTQTNYEKAKLIISVIKDTVLDPENYQYHIVKRFFKAYHINNLELAYNIANESFNDSMIAGYKYLELCKLAGYKGEFFEIASKNPLMNL